MQVIIPAAGSGQRFKDAGYLQPKPFIPVNGVPMIRRVMTMVEGIDPCPHIILQQQDVDSSFGSCVSDAYNVVIQHKQNGPALTVLCANGHVPDNEPVMVVDCDNEIDQKCFNEFAILAQKRAAFNECTMLTTVSSNSGNAWSFVEGLVHTKKIVCVAEKRRISDRIFIGAVAFPSWAALRRGICHMVADKASVKSEFYLAPVLNYFAWAYYHDIPLSAFHTFGTPETLQAYEKELQ